MILDRWAGEPVLRYARDAPLDAIPDEVKALEDKKTALLALTRLQATVQAVDDKVEGRQAELAQLVKEACARFGPTVAKPFVTKGGRRSFKLHEAAVDGVEVLPALWRTKCGIRFANWSFTRRSSPQGFPRSRAAGG